MYAGVCDGCVVPLPPQVDREVQMKFLLVSNSGTFAAYSSTQCKAHHILTSFPPSALCLCVCVGHPETEGALFVARRTAQMVGMPYDIYAVAPANGTTCYTGMFTIVFLPIHA